MSLPIPCRQTCALAVTLSMGLLSACGGGGGSAPAEQAGGNTSLELSTTGEPLTVGGETAIDVQTRIEGDRVPGQRVRLTASDDADNIQSVSWQQTGGPQVMLDSNGDNTAQFRVPPVKRDTSFSFRLDITDREGRQHRRYLHVDVKALSWHHLKVVEPEVTGSFIVFRANKDNNLRVDLYRADLDGTNIQRLNGPLAPGGNVHSFSISPDGQKVAYLADEDSSGVFELYLVDAAGGDSVRISSDLVSGGNVTPDFQWSPDSSRMAYRADANDDEVFELFAAHADQSPSVRLSGPMTLNGDVTEADFFWSGDSMRIAYRANQFNDNTLELFVSARDGSANQRVSAPAVVNGGVLGNFAWMPGGSRLAYIADQQTENLFELFVVNHDASDNLRVSGPIVSGGSVLDFQWSPNGAVIAYRAEQLTDELVELYSVNADASDNTLVSALPPGGDVGSYQWNAAGTSIAYLADQDSDEVVELYVAGADGSANRRVSAPLSGDGDVLDFAWSPADNYLAYRASDNGSNDTELFTSTPNGAVNVKVSGPLASQGDVLSDWRWTPDSNWLIYRADQRSNESFELFSSAPDGAVNLLISGSLAPGGDVSSPEGNAFQISADSSRVVYSADQQQDDRFELYVTAPDSGVAIASVSGPLTSGGDVRNFAMGSRPASLAQLSGVQTNLPLDALLGWEQCFSGLYADDGVQAINDILTACDRDNLMMACRPVGSTVLTVAAWGPRAAVTADTGQTNVTNRANDVEWYFNDDWSWGFAAVGEEVSRNSCDTRNGQAEQRLAGIPAVDFSTAGFAAARPPVSMVRPTGSG